MALPPIQTPRIFMRPWTRHEVDTRGLAAEACTTALDYLWLSTTHRRVYARTDPPNERSIRVMQRLGMTHDSSTGGMVCYRLDHSDCTPG